MARPSRRGISIAALGAVFAALPAITSERLWPIWVLYCGAVALLLGMEYLLAVRPGRVSLELRSPEILFIGEPDDLALSLRVPAPRAVPCEVLADLSPDLLPQPSFRGACPPEGLEVRFPLEPRRRGTAVVESVWVRYSGPLRLLDFVARFPLERRIPVVPNILPARRAALKYASSRSFLAGLKIERYAGDGTEFDSLRDFKEGDDHRTIHWRSSARHLTLLRRQFRAERNHQVVFALDTGRLMCEPLSGGVPKLDHAVSAVLLLCFVCLKSGDRVGLYTFDERPGLFAAPQGGMDHLRTLSYLTSQIDYTTSETNFTLGLTELLQKLGRRSLVVVLTDFVDTTTAGLMVENLGRLARKHLSVFVGLADRDLERLAAARVDTVRDLNRAVAASAYLQERHLILRTLERKGLLTIDAEPDRVGTELINRYLYIKRRELI